MYTIEVTLFSIVYFIENQSTIRVKVLMLVGTDFVQYMDYTNSDDIQIRK